MDDNSELSRSLFKEIVTFVRHPQPVITCPVMSVRHCWSRDSIPPRETNRRWPRSQYGFYFHVFFNIINMLSNARLIFQTRLLIRCEIATAKAV